MIRNPTPGAGSAAPRGRQAAAPARAAAVPAWGWALLGAPAVPAWGWALLAAAVLVIWAGSAPVGDLFMSLAGGLDIVRGKLGRPDEWSFMTNGRVWMDQNWLAHLLIYLAWRTGGEYALHVLKAALLSAMALLVLRVARERGAPWPAAMAIASALVLATFRFVVLRPNLFTLVLVPLAMLLLRGSHSDRRHLWWFVPLMCLWANVHGGFVLGLLMLGLWVACEFAADLARAGSAALRRDWPLAALMAACVAVCMVSPFGVRNLTHPFVIASSQAWRKVSEWQPLLLPNALPFPWEFFVVLLALAALGAVRLLSHSGRTAPRARAAAEPTGEFASVLFEWLLVALATLMAFQSRRFVPIAVLTAAAPFAALLAAFPQRARGALSALVALAATAGTLAVGWQNAQSYRADHPIRKGSSVFDRMYAVSDYFPVGAGAFLRENRITGNAFAEWEWEGYLRWVVPGVRLFTGGRAQQAYSEDILAISADIQNSSAGPRLLRDHAASLVVVSQAPRYAPLLARLRASGQWPCLYADGHDVVLVDARSAATAALLERARSGTLQYPSEVTRAISHAMFALSSEAAPDSAVIRADAQAANRALASPLAYQLFASYSDTPALRPAALAYLEAEAARLAGLPAGGRGSQQLRRSRVAAEDALSRLYAAQGRRDDAARADEAARVLYEQAEAVKAAWR